MNIQRIRVPLGFLLGIVFLVFARPTIESLGYGLGIAAIGLALRVWATGHLRKWKGLAVSGPYRWTRNPLYLGSFIMGIGFMLASNRLWLLVIFLAGFVLVYWPVMRREEGELAAGYPGDFPAYRSQVPLFFPSLAGRRWPLERSKGNFNWDSVISNREYNAIVGFLLIGLFLWLKMTWV